MAEREVRQFSDPVGTHEILWRFVERGMYIHEDAERILRKSMSKSGRFIVASQQPTLWQARLPPPSYRLSNRRMTRQTLTA
jgi:hypothetical protein